MRWSAHDIFLLPDVLSNREAVAGIAKLVDPLVRKVDETVGEKVVSPLLTGKRIMGGPTWRGDAVPVT